MNLSPLDYHRLCLAALAVILIGLTFGVALMALVWVGVLLDEEG